MFTVQCRDSTGAAYDFNGMSPYLDIVTDLLVGTTPFSQLSEGAGLTTDTLTGDIVVSVPTTDTVDLCPQGRDVDVYGDLELRSADVVPTVITLAQFRFVVSREATRRG